VWARYMRSKDLALRVPEGHGEDDGHFCSYRVGCFLGFDAQHMALEGSCNPLYQCLLFCDAVLCVKLG
jgi:hypothetical protein